MYRKAALIWILTTWLFTIAAYKIAAQESAYSVVQTLALHQKPNGTEGKLQLLMDKRLTESVREKLWEKGDWSFVFPPESSTYKEFSSRPPVKSRLVIRNDKGKVIAERGLETPMAKLEPWNPSSDSNQFFLLTEDYSSGAGSYNGPGTSLLQISDAAFHDVKADTASGQEQPIRLVKSLKSDWQIVSRDNAGEILSVSCRPKSDGNFVIGYTRYSFDGNQWRKYKREVDGFWESDDPFPDRSAFP